MNSDDHSSPLRELISSANKQTYEAFASLADARRDPSSVVILEGDDGGQIYVVARTEYVKCDEPSIRCLLCCIDSHFWDDPEMARVVYERRSPGETISGGMGGAVAPEAGVWLHKHVSDLGLAEGIVAVLEGRRERLEPDEPPR